VNCSLRHNFSVDNNLWFKVWCW